MKSKTRSNKLALAPNKGKLIENTWNENVQNSKKFIIWNSKKLLKVLFLIDDAEQNSEFLKIYKYIMHNRLFKLNCKNENAQNSFLLEVLKISKKCYSSPTIQSKNYVPLKAHKYTLHTRVPKLDCKNT